MNTKYFDEREFLRRWLHSHCDDEWSLPFGLIFIRSFYSQETNFGDNWTIFDSSHKKKLCYLHAKNEEGNIKKRLMKLRRSRLVTSNQLQNSSYCASIEVLNSVVSLFHISSVDILFFFACLASLCANENSTKIFKQHRHVPRSRLKLILLTH
jgi:hypothetical protein